MHLLWSFFCHKNMAVWKLATFTRRKPFFRKRLFSNCKIHIYIFTYSMEQSPSLEITGFQLVKKIPAFYGTRRFMTAVTSARHLSLSWASSIQTMPPHFSFWRSILILSSHLRLGLPRHTYTTLYIKTLYFYSIILVN